MPQFLNVYNFIPSPEKKESAYVDDGGKKHTGVITYTITTKTPLFIPNSSTDDAFQMRVRGRDEDRKHLSYDFYSYREMEDGKDYTNSLAMPIISGSELRGMVRNIYETLTDSCMGVLNGKKMPVLRSGEKFQAGLLVKISEDKYEIEPAKACTYKKGEKNQFEEGQRVYVEPIEKKSDYWVTYICKAKKEKECNGYIVKGEDFYKKNPIRAFVRNEGCRTILIEKDDVERLEMVIQSYQSQPGLKNTKNKPYNDYENNLKAFKASGEVGAKLPVYYSVVSDFSGNRQIYLSPACITKELSHHTIKKLAGDIVPCDSSATICPACDLFGRIGENMAASKIRFTDARPELLSDVKAYYEKKVTLPALGEPKLGAVEFYLENPGGNALFWTYDYHVTSKHEMKVEPGKLRGRKYYWHQPKMGKLESVVPTNLNKTVRPVKPEVTFTGKMYYEGISERQLEQLKWILNGGTGDKNLMYKLGSGKPFGMGSVKCQVTEVKERTVALTAEGISYIESIADQYILPYDDEKVRFSETAKDAFILMADFDAEIVNRKDIKICYPVTENQFLNNDLRTKGFDWFVENHGRNIKPRGHEVKNALPELKFENGVLEGNLLMPCHKKEDKKGKPFEKNGRKGNQQQSNRNNNQQGGQGGYGNHDRRDKRDGKGFDKSRKK